MALGQSIINYYLYYSNRMRRDNHKVNCSMQLVFEVREYDLVFQEFKIVLIYPHLSLRGSTFDIKSPKVNPNIEFFL